MKITRRSLKISASHDAANYSVARSARRSVEGAIRPGANNDVNLVKPYAGVLKRRVNNALRAAGYDVSAQLDSKSVTWYIDIDSAGTKISFTLPFTAIEIEDDPTQDSKEVAARIQELAPTLSTAEVVDLSVESATQVTAAADIDANYADEFASLVVETLSDSGIYANYRIVNDAIQFIIYTDPHKSAVWTTVTKSFDELMPDDKELRDLAEDLAEEIEAHLDDASDEVYSNTSVTDISDKDAIYGTKSFKNSEAYKRLKEYGYKLELNKDGCTIKFSDGDPYATFKFSPPDLSDLDDWEKEHMKDYGLDEWLVYADGEMINDRIDFPPNNYDDAVLESINYFWSHY